MSDAPIRVVAADDEPIARRGLERALRAEGGIDLVALCQSGGEVLDAIRTHRPQLALLDIAMPEMSGIEVARALKPAERPAIIFITAFDRFAIDAFDLHAVDYLLKPFDGERLHTAIAHARQRLQNAGASDERLSVLLDAFAARERASVRIAVKQGDRTVIVPVSEIDSCEAADNYVRIYTAGRKYLVRDTMKMVEQQLDPSAFVRIHRSAIVNLVRVRELRPLFHGDYQVILADGVRLTLSRTYRENVLRRVGG
jgi:two-component system LytT family response regulator